MEILKLERVQMKFLKLNVSKLRVITDYHHHHHHHHHQPNVGVRGAVIVNGIVLSLTLAPRPQVGHTHVGDSSKEMSLNQRYSKRKGILN